MDKITIISSGDNVAVALEDLKAGEVLNSRGVSLMLAENISAKHKLALEALNEGDTIIMYGVPVAEVVKPIPKGGVLSTTNIKHRAAGYSINIGSREEYSYKSKAFPALQDRFFNGFHRKDGQVGTANYWLFIPLVFCQNRNIQVLKEAFETELGYKNENSLKLQLRMLIDGEFAGNNSDIFQRKEQKVFENIDGIKFLTHEGGCGGTRADAQALVNLLAGYVKNPNVAGATVLSLGCQHAQMNMLQEALELINNLKPVLYFEQQQYSSENQMLTEIVDKTYQELKQVNTFRREPAPLNKLSIGLECGGSDGLSGITANPLIGLVSDKINAVGGTSILSEFPELCGVEQDLIDRCMNKDIASKFVSLMEAYNNRAREVGSGFDMNPSPGNIKDGLITDAIKSAGAATKGGRAPISDVLDYGEYITNPGLNLLCTPGNDVESTTGLAGSGANLILFSTGLGTPTGNPICPVIKISSNSKLPQKMNDIIDFDAGKFISERKSLEDLSDDLIDLIIEVASGKQKTCADNLGQDDFIPWKRGVSL